ncbi:MAG: PhzF family phenazine biosynthesis protein [Bacillota bacterium]|nr:PhzF family phenazine biosynthesis protein [Bacillota bacterium]
MRFYIVDAFSKELFGGNPAGVVLLGDADFPKEEVMQKTAAELRYSETAFVRQIGENAFHTRYFTPEAEVDLCGHATIALFHALCEEGIIPSNGECTNQTLAGNLRVKLKDGMVFMQMGEPETFGRIEDEQALRDLYHIMGIADAAPDTDSPLLPEMISTGLPDIMLPVKDEEVLSSISPDFAKLSRLSEEYNVVGVHAFTTESKDGQIHVRNFAPRYAIDEEAATGTSNGALTYYLYKNNLLKKGDQTVFIQGEAMGRPSEIVSLLDDEERVEIVIGGRAVTLARGEIYY